MRLFIVPEVLAKLGRHVATLPAARNWPERTRNWRRVLWDRPTSTRCEWTANWRKRVRVERTNDIEDAVRRF